MVGAIIRCPICEFEWEQCECVSGMQLVELCAECEAENEFCSLCGCHACDCHGCGCDGGPR